MSRVTMKWEETIYHLRLQLRTCSTFPSSDKRPQILAMENGLNFDTAIPAGNLTIVSDQYYVDCRPLANAHFGQKSANISFENGLNLDTDSRTGNLLIVSDRYTVHWWPLANAVFVQTSANISNGEWTKSRHIYSDGEFSYWSLLLRGF